MWQMIPETNDRSQSAGSCAPILVLRVLWLSAFCGAAGVRLSGDVSVSCAAVQDAPAVVLGVGVAESLPLDGLDDPVGALGGAIG